MLLDESISKEYDSDMSKEAKTISDQLRAAIESAPVSRYRISQDTGIAEPTLSRFMLGKGGLRLSAIDTIGKYLGLKLVAEKPAKKTKREG